MMGPITGRRPALAGLAVASAALLAACGGSAQAGQNPRPMASASVGYGGSYGAATSSGSSTAVAASTATVRLIKTSKGKILANRRGFTLYLFTADRRKVDRCVKKPGCAAVWPPLTVRGRPTAGRGVNAKLLSTIRLPNGKHQVTYAGHPLYRYTGDSGPGATSYIGFSAFGGIWYGVNAAGHAVH
jgi:predicted lipoprotein with Yx(FWY)xxD motif